MQTSYGFIHDILDQNLFKTRYRVEFISRGEICTQFSTRFYTLQEFQEVMVFCLRMLYAKYDMIHTSGGYCFLYVYVTKKLQLYAIQAADGASDFYILASVQSGPLS
eukprot:766203-Hanusia_phi.AAC.2